MRHPVPIRFGLRMFPSAISPFILFFFLFFFLAPASAQAQSDSIPSHSVRVFLDCGFCDRDYLRSEITFVDYVRDRADAQVHILVTTQSNGGGGTEYTASFIGQQKYLGINDTLVFSIKKSISDEDARKALSRTLKLGLIRYASRTPLAEHITIGFDQPAAPAEAAEDPWNYWVFSVSARTNLSGEQSNTSSSFSSSLSANRVTKDLKVNLSMDGRYNENNYSADDYSYKSVSRSKGVDGTVVFSLDDHWSAGGSAAASASTYSNKDLSLSAGPAIEYNLFPYSESTRRQLRFSYNLEVRRVDYTSVTIYDKDAETLVREEFSVSLSQKETWGTANISINGSHYFHDFNKYNVGTFASLNLRMFEGFSVNIFGDYSKPHDQLALPKGEVADEDVLLERRELETQYRYYVSVGISYTFGSIFNSIVNPRFGGSGGMMFYSD